MTEQLETRMTVIESAIEAMQKNLEKLTELVTGLAVVDERIQSMGETLKDHRRWLGDLQKQANAMEKRCAENHGKPDPDHDATVKNSQVSRVVVKLLLLGGGAVIGAIVRQAIGG